MDMDDKKRYRIQHKLSQEDRIEMFGTIALLPQVDECRIHLQNNKVGSKASILCYPGTDPRTWSQFATAENFSGSRAVIRIGTHKYRITFDQRQGIVISDMSEEALDEEGLEDILDCIDAYCGIER